MTPAYGVDFARPLHHLELIRFCGVLPAVGGGFQDAQKQAPVPHDFRARMLDLVRSGRTVGSLAREFSVSQQSIRAWMKQADLDAGRRQEGLTTEERQEFARLKKEKARLREGRDILGKPPFVAA